MLKKSFLSIVVLVLVILSCTSCKKETIYGDSLTADEIERLEAVKDDIQVISESAYVSAVTEFQAHTHEYAGQIFQIEGVYSEKYGHGEVACVYRSVMSEGRELIYPMLISGFTKEVEEGTWIRVTGILSSKADDHGHTNTVLDVLAIEILSKEGSALISAE